MYPLFEDQTKAELKARGLPVPRGSLARTVDEAVAAIASLGEDLVVKACVPTGRRGKSGGVRIVSGRAACAKAAKDILGSTVAAYVVHGLYLEEKVGIARELYLSIMLKDDRIKVLLSANGGVDIEEIFANSPESIVNADVDILAGLTPWRAIDLWREAGVAGPVLRDLGNLTAKLFKVFVECDATTLEINPLAVTSDSHLVLVGAMMAIDEHAIYRHPHLRQSTTESGKENEREKSVRDANALYAGGEAQYVELNGDIGLLVGGGGAGLHLHDLILEEGGSPANHCVTPPTGSDTRKLKAVLSAILRNPKAKGLLVGFNFAQMARADLRMRVLGELIRELNIDTTSFPIVIRMFGAGEVEARAMASEFPGVHYMDRGSSLHAAAVEIVRRVGGRR